VAGEQQAAEAEDVAELSGLGRGGIRAVRLELGDPALHVPDERAGDRVGGRQRALGQRRDRLVADSEPEEAALQLVLDFVGVDTTLAVAAGAVAPGGHVSIVGVGGGTFPMRFGAVPAETPVVFSNWGSRAELAEVVELARAGAIELEVETVRLADVPAAYERLESGGVRGRVVAVPAAATATSRC
jgi:propanol-preferring alcohol dehydrogenase